MTKLEQHVSQSNANNDTLILAHVIFRHGERTIKAPYPNDPYKNEAYWPEGFGQLTNEGKRQMYRLGQYFRSRYGNLIEPKYSPDQIYVQSTDFDRTIMSAQMALAGLYPPTDEEKWSNEILWQPVPVHTIPMSIDNVLSFGNGFPKLTAAIEKYMTESPEVQRIYTEYADLFTHWSQKSGSNIRTIGDVYNLHKTLTIEKERNMLLPDWAEEAIEPNGIMEYIANFDFQISSSTTELAKLKSGSLIKEIIGRFAQKIDSTLQPDRSLWLYSAHDFTISNVLNSLGFFELHIPPTAASLHFELYKSEENDYYIQIFYRKCNEEYPVPIKMPRCGEKCSLDQFYDLYKEIIPDD